MLHCIYRTSDVGLPKNKLPNATREECLKNFLSNFKKTNVTIIADNCNDATIKNLQNMKLKVIETNVGNSGSFLFSLDYAIKNFDEDDYVYFVENDYFHKKKSVGILLEGLEIADYVTLYDHPDKYQLYSPNPFVENGGEITKVFITNNTHWKATNSTTMTFAAQIKTLKKDKDIFTLFCQNKVPEDFPIFRILTRHFLHNYDEQIFHKLNLKQRLLISPIPGYSTHCEVAYLSPFEDWSKY